MKIVAYFIDLFSKKTEQVIATYCIIREDEEYVSQLISVTYKSGKVNFKTKIIK